MTPFLKIVTGLVLLIPSAALLAFAWIFRVDHPALTEMQLFNQIGWAPALGFVLCIPGVVLIEAGIEENEEAE